MSTNITIANIIFVIGMLFLIAWSVKTTIDIITISIDNTITKSRLKQFGKNVKEKDKSKKETVDSLTEVFRTKYMPLLQKYFPSLRFDKEQLEKDLKFIGWNEFTADTYFSTNMLLRIGGIVVFLVFLLLNDLLFIILGAIISALMMFYLDYDFKSQVKNKKDALFSEFPDMIRIVTGYLVAGMDLNKAMEYSIPYVSPEWEESIIRFIQTSKTSGQTAALDELKDVVDMFEVREFVALVKLTIDQGGKEQVKKSFLEQAEKIKSLQKTQFVIKVGTRKTFATVIQGPMLLVNMFVIAYPMFATTMKGIF